LIGRVVSGGQTGVDRAALDVARDLAIPVGGWCPRGGWAEDAAPLLELYPELRETPSDDPAERTAWNVRDCDAVLVIRWDDTSPGTDLALRTADELGRPVLVTSDAAEARAFVETLPEGAVLSVGGPRESEAAGAYERASRLLREVLSPSGSGR
jgi:hypothetical protein